MVSEGPFLECPGNFSGPKSNIQIEIYRIRARVLVGKLPHFDSLTDSCIMLDAKLLTPRSLCQRRRHTGPVNIIGTFEKRALHRPVLNSHVEETYQEKYNEDRNTPYRKRTGIHRTAYLPFPIL